MELKIHRGTKEIGGSCVEMRTALHKILVDIGLPLDYDSKTDEQKNVIRENARCWSKDADAIFISHYHVDHYGLLSEVPLSVPVYVTKGTAKMFKINDVFLTGKSRIENLKIITDPVCIGNFRITPYIIDHSAYDACALLVEVEGKRILYSGDIRTHGMKGILYKNLPVGVDVLLLEGTNIEKDKLSKSERNIEEDFLKLFSEDKLNYVWCSGQNIDRLVCIYRACLKTGKIFVVDVYVANILEEIHAINSKIPAITSHQCMKVYYPYGTTKRLKENGNYTYATRLNPSRNKVKPVEIKDDPKKYVVIVRPSLLSIMKKIDAEYANVITSMWKEYEKKETIFFQWVDEKQYSRKHIHTSGHADRKSLQNIVNHISPVTIIPIHTETKVLYTEVFGQNVKLIDDNELINL